MTMTDRIDDLFVKLRGLTCRVLPFGSEFVGPLRAGRSPKRTIEPAFETDLRRGLKHPDKVI